ncbi:MAG: response regulator [Tabrizicola sp.]|nr:response regulator [Tabrizicola sp.]
MKIVIVDDNLSMRKVLAALFESSGHQVVATLEDGSGLVACVRQLRPDLVCLDYNLPGRNGLDLLRDLHSSEPDTDVVMITGSNEAELEGLAADAGAWGFLKKPFSQPQILEELKQVEAARRLVIKAASAPDGETPTAPGRAAPTAVVIDDSGSMRLLLKGILEDIGLIVLKTAGNGKEGVEAVGKLHPAIVSLDVDMPGMSGLEALPLIRQASPQTKVVMVTGNPSKGFVETAIAGGAGGYILKPLRPAYVEGFMKKLLRPE